MSEQRPPAESDDLAVWADDDLVQALRAPGTPAELAGQDRFVAAFREAGRPGSRLPRRAAGRLGAGGTAVVVTVALTSGVAAAYTGRLPDPVQQIAHTVLGAPAPDAGGRHRASAASHGGHVAPPPSSPVEPSAGATDAPSSAPTGSPSETSGATARATARATASAPGRHTTGGPVLGPTPSQSAAPSSEPTTQTPSPGTGASASAMSMSAPTHRVEVGQTVSVTGVVTDAAGAPLPNHAVVLQARDPRRWHALIRATTDASGMATVTTPAITRSVRLRWRADPGVASAVWLVRMVPTVAVTADVEGGATTLLASTRGSSPDDRVEVFRHAAGRTMLVRTARVDASGSAQTTVTTPHRKAAYVVRLIATRRHTAAAARVVVVPPRPAAVSVTGAASRVTVGGSTVISGTVTSSTGGALPGRRVVLLRRGPARWLAVGHAVTDDSGSVSMPTPAIEGTTLFRLRTGTGVRSAAWRVVELPTLSVSARSSGSDATVSATATGGRTGDRVVLLRRVDGRLVRVRHGVLDAGGGATFVVPVRKLATTYVVRLLATAKHGAASARVTVPGTG